MRRSTPATTVTAAVGLLVVAACHRAPPSSVAQSIRPANADGARMARARADSIARAEQARRDAAARAAAQDEDARRAREAARNAEASVRMQLVAPLHFEFDRAEISEGDRALLEQKAVILLANRAIRVRIEGNTDERGSDEYNLALGMRRATEARRYLLARGVEAERIDVNSLGEERPVCHEEDESCWSQNRRDEFVIVAGGDRITAAH